MSQNIMDAPSQVGTRSHGSEHGHPHPHHARGVALASKLVRIHSKLALSASSVGSSLSGGGGGDLAASEGEVLPLRLRAHNLE
jgi:hypothetical protein